MVPPLPQPQPDPVAVAVDLPAPAPPRPPGPAPVVNQVQHQENDQQAALLPHRYRSRAETALAPHHPGASLRGRELQEGN